MMGELLKGYFTVPIGMPDEKVLANIDKYLERYCESYAKEGWRLNSKVVYRRGIQTTEDIRDGKIRWEIFALWNRKPITQTFEVNENLIPKLLSTGKFNLPSRKLY